MRLVQVLLLAVAAVSGSKVRFSDGPGDYSCTGTRTLLPVCRTADIITDTVVIERVGRNLVPTCSPALLPKIPLRIQSSGFIGSLFNGWVAQILLMEQLQMPVKIVSHDPTVEDVVDFYEWEPTGLKFGNAYGTESLVQGSLDWTCSQYKTRGRIGYCAHYMPQVWSGQDLAFEEAQTAGPNGKPGVVKLGQSGVIATFKWMTQTSVIKRYPSMSSFRGLRDRAVISRFQFPHSLQEYCFRGDTNGPQVSWLGNAHFCTVIRNALLAGPWTSTTVAFKPTLTARHQFLARRLINSFFIMNLLPSYAELTMLFREIADAGITPGTTSFPFWRGNFTQLYENGQPVGTLVTAPCDWSVRDHGIIQGLGLFLGTKTASGAEYEDKLAEIHDAGISLDVPVLMNVGVPGLPSLRSQLDESLELTRVYLPDPFASCVTNRTTEADRCANKWKSTPCDYDLDLTYKAGAALDLSALPQYMQQAFSALSQVQVDTAADEEVLFRTLLDPVSALRYPDMQVRMRVAACEWVKENQFKGLRWGSWMSKLAQPVCPNDCVARGESRGTCTSVPGAHPTVGRCACQTGWGNAAEGCSECAPGYHLVSFRDGNAQKFDCTRCPIGTNREICSGNGACNATYIGAGIVLVGPDSPCVCSPGYAHATNPFNGACELKVTPVPYMAIPVRIVIGCAAGVFAVFLFVLGLQLVVRRDSSLFGTTPLWIPLSLVFGGTIGLAWVVTMLLDVSTFVCHGRLWFGALTTTSLFGVLWGYLHTSLAKIEYAISEAELNVMASQGANPKKLEALETKAAAVLRVEIVKVTVTLGLVFAGQLLLLFILSLSEDLHAELVYTDDLATGLRSAEVKCTGDNYIILLFGIIGLSVSMVCMSIYAAYRIQEQEVSDEAAYTRFAAYAVYAGAGLFLVLLPVTYTLQRDTAALYATLSLGVLVVSAVIQGLSVLTVVTAAHREYLDALDASLESEMERLNASARRDALLDLARKRAAGASSPLHTVINLSIPPMCAILLLVPPIILFASKGIIVASLVLGAVMQSGGMYALSSLSDTLAQWRHESKLRSFREFEPPTEKLQATSKMSVLRVAGNAPDDEDKEADSEETESDQSWNSDFTEEDSSDGASGDDVALLTAHDAHQAVQMVSRDESKLRQLLLRFSRSGAGRMRDTYMLVLTPLWCISYFWATYYLSYEPVGDTKRWTDTASPSWQRWMEAVLYWAFALDAAFEMTLSTNHVQWLRSSFVDLLPLFAYIPVYLFGVNMLSQSAFTAYVSTGFLRFSHMRRVPQFFMRYRARGHDSPQHKATTQIMIYCTTLAVGACMVAGLMFAFEGPLQELELHHFFYFAIVTMSTVGFGDISPGTIFTQLVITSIIVLGLVFVPYLAGEIARLTTIKNHIGEIPSSRDDLVTLICATLPPSSLNRVLLEVSTGSNSNMGKVCVVSEDPPTDELAAVVHKHSHVTTRMAYYFGSTLQDRTLTDCHFKSAATCIVVSSLAAEDAEAEDDSTVARVLALKHVLSSAARVIVQLRKGGKGFRYLAQHGVTDVACVERLRARLCGANAVTPGLNAVVLGLCSKDRGKPVLEWQRHFIRGLGNSVYSAFIPQRLAGILFHEFSAFALTVGRVLPIGVVMQFPSRAPFPILNPGSGLAMREGDLVVFLASRQQLVDNAMEAMIRILDDADLDAQLRRRIDGSRLSYGGAERLAREYSSRAELVMMSTENERTRLHREASFISASRIDVSMWLPIREFYVLSRAPPQDTLLVPTVASVGIKNHILISAHERDLFDIIQPLRTRSLNIISPVVILAQSDLDPIVWSAVGRFQDVFIMHGDSSNDADLERAGVSTASCVMLLLDSISEDTDMRSIVKLSALTAAQQRGATAKRYKRELLLTRKRMREEALDVKNMDAKTATEIRNQMKVERKTSTLANSARAQVRRQTRQGSFLFGQLGISQALATVRGEGSLVIPKDDQSQPSESSPASIDPQLMALRVSLEKRQQRGVSGALERASSFTKDASSGGSVSLLSGLGGGGKSVADKEDKREEGAPSSLLTMLEFLDGASVLHAELSAATVRTLSHEAVGADGDPLLRLVPKDEFEMVRKHRESMLHSREIEAMRRMKAARKSQGVKAADEISHYTLTRSYAAGTAFSMQPLEGLIGQMVHTDHVSAVVDELVLPHTGLTIAGLQSRVVLTEVPKDAEGYSFVELARSLLLNEEIVPIALFRRHSDRSGAARRQSGRVSSIWADAAAAGMRQQSRYVITFPPPELCIQHDDLVYVLARGAKVAQRVLGCEMTSSVMGIERQAQEVA